MMKEQEILAHFEKVDSIMFAAAKKAGVRKMDPPQPKDYFSHLCREIVGQQLSGKVAKVIFARLQELVGEVTAKHILQASDEDLRGVGMAWSKVRSIKDLAQKVVSKELVLDQLNTLDNEQITSELIKVKGIGPWTAEMFLMFTLGKEDIFAPGDLGLKKGIAKLYNIEKPTNEQMDEISSKWSPYRTYASLILWRIQDG